MSVTTEMTENKYLLSWLALHLVPGMGPVTCRKLVDHFGSPENVLAASMEDLAAESCLRQVSLDALHMQGRQKLKALAQKEIDTAAAKNITIIACDDPLYPSRLKNIHDYPVVLYVLGDPELLECKGIGIVGSRAATQYGRSIAAQLAASLARHGFTTISGMALGIDTAAHKGALAEAGRTIAVLGCGLDIIYPPSNHRLYHDMTISGAIVSEYPLGTLPEHFRFPARNRIISGLSLGVVVVEAANRSGSLITAGHALEQGREVFAVPGRIDSLKSAGTHTLLQQGAKLVHSVNDILEEFSDTWLCVKPPEADPRDQTPMHGLKGEEAALFSYLDVYPQSIDQIVRESNLSPQKTNELLLRLELKGMVQLLPGNCYQKAAGLADK